MIDYGLFMMIYKPSKLIYSSVHIDRVYHFIRDHFSRIPLYTYISFNGPRETTSRLLFNRAVRLLWPMTVSSLSAFRSTRYLFYAPYFTLLVERTLMTQQPLQPCGYSYGILMEKEGLRGLSCLIATDIILPWFLKVFVERTLTKQKTRDPEWQVTINCCL